MRRLSILLILIAIGLSCLLIACGDDDNPTGPTNSVTTFWRSFDFGEDDHFSSLAEGGGGTIVVGGLAEMEIIDSSVSPPVIDTSGEALLAKCRSNGDTIWTTIFGREATSDGVDALTPDGGGGYMAAVLHHYTGGPGADFSVQQIGGDGVLGPSSFYDADQLDRVFDIRPCSDGNFLLAGDRDNILERNVAYVAKVDPGGSAIWQKEFAYPNINLMPERVLELPDGTLIAAGRFNPANGDDVDLHVLRLSADGDSLYGKVIPLGGRVGVLDIEAISDGGYKVLLRHASDRYACAVVFMDNLGEVTSVQYSFRSDYTAFENGEFTPDGGAILCCEFQTDAGVYAGLLIKLDAAGRMQWEKEFEDPDAAVYFKSVLDYSGGGYVIAGYRRLLLDDSYESLLIRTDENGNVPQAP